MTEMEDNWMKLMRNLLRALMFWLGGRSMATDIPFFIMLLVLSWLVSTIASELIFSTNGRVICPYKSSLSPKIVGVLVCSQNWFRAKPISADVQTEKNEVEELEQIEHVINSIQFI